MSKICFDLEGFFGWVLEFRLEFVGEDVSPEFVTLGDDLGEDELSGILVQGVKRDGGLGGVKFVPVLVGSPGLGWLAIFSKGSPKSQEVLGEFVVIGSLFNAGIAIDLPWELISDIVTMGGGQFRGELEDVEGAALGSSNDDVSVDWSDLGVKDGGEEGGTEEETIGGDVSNSNLVLLVGLQLAGEVEFGNLLGHGDGVAG